MINVRRAEIKDIPMIMQFLDEHWLKGYALAHNRELFDWQFVKDGKVNIWIGVDDEEGKMYAMQGAVVYNPEAEKPDVSGILLIAIKSPNPLLAMDVQAAMTNELHPRDTFSPGLHDKAIRINQLLGYTVVNMEHYYRLADIDDYKIAKINNKIIPKVNNWGLKMFHLDSIDQVKTIMPEKILKEAIPSKSFSYLEWRYFNHPVFKYDIWEIIANDGTFNGLLVTRDENSEGKKSCKIVDFYGDTEILGRITYLIDELIIYNNYEFVDVYSFGVPKDVYENGGWVRCDSDSNNVIPNYFQPFSQTNTDIKLVPPGVENTRLFRGDSDQDKPRY